MAVKIEIQSDTTQAERAVSKLRGTLASVSEVAANSAKSIDNISSSRININTDLALASLERVEDSLRSIEKNSKRAASRLRDNIKFIVDSFSLLPVRTGATFAVRTAATFETLLSRLKIATGSAEAAGAAFAEIKVLAAQTPFAVSQITDGYSRLIQSGSALVDSQEEIIRGLKGIANAVASVGGNDATFADLTSALSKIASQGKVTLEKLEPIVSSGISLRAIASKIGFDGADGMERFFEAITAGEIKFERFYQGFLEYVELDLGGAAADQVNTLNGAFSNFNDAIAELGDAVVRQSGLSGIIVRAIQSVNSFINNLAAKAGPAVAELITELVISYSQLRRVLSNSETALDNFVYSVLLASQITFQPIIDQLNLLKDKFKELRAEADYTGRTFLDAFAGSISQDADKFDQELEKFKKQFKELYQTLEYQNNRIRELNLTSVVESFREAVENFVAVFVDFPNNFERAEAAYLSFSSTLSKSVFLFEELKDSINQTLETFKNFSLSIPFLPRLLSAVRFAVLPILELFSSSSEVSLFEQYKNTVKLFFSDLFSGTQLEQFTKLGDNLARVLLAIVLPVQNFNELLGSEGNKAGAAVSAFLLEIRKISKIILPDFLNPLTNTTDIKEFKFDYIEKLSEFFEYLLSILSKIEFLKPVLGLFASLNEYIAFLIEKLIDGKELLDIINSKLESFVKSIIDIKKSSDFNFIFGGFNQRDLNNFIVAVNNLFGAIIAGPEEFLSSQGTLLEKIEYRLKFFVKSVLDLFESAKKSIIEFFNSIKTYLSDFSVFEPLSLAISSNKEILGESNSDSLLDLLNSIRSFLKDFYDALIFPDDANLVNIAAVYIDAFSKEISRFKIFLKKEYDSLSDYLSELYNTLFVEDTMQKPKLAGFYAFEIPDINPPDTLRQRVLNAWYSFRNSLRSLYNSVIEFFYGKDQSIIEDLVKSEKPTGFQRLVKNIAKAWDGVVATFRYIAENSSAIGSYVQDTAKSIFSYVYDLLSLDTVFENLFGNNDDNQGKKSIGFLQRNFGIYGQAIRGSYKLLSDAILESANLFFESKPAEAFNKIQTDVANSIVIFFKVIKASLIKGIDFLRSEDFSARFYNFFETVFGKVFENFSTDTDKIIASLLLSIFLVFRKVRTSIRLFNLALTIPIIIDIPLVKETLRKAFLGSGKLVGGIFKSESEDIQDGIQKAIFGDSDDSLVKKTLANFRLFFEAFVQGIVTEILGSEENSEIAKAASELGNSIGVAIGVGLLLYFNKSFKELLFGTNNKGKKGKKGGGLLPGGVIGLITGAFGSLFSAISFAITGRMASTAQLATSKLGILAEKLKQFSFFSVGLALGSTLLKGISDSLENAATILNAKEQTVTGSIAELGAFGTAIASEAAEFAIYGAAIASVIPGIGTLSGAVAGALAGAIFGAFDQLQERGPQIGESLSKLYSVIKEKIEEHIISPLNSFKDTVFNFIVSILTFDKVLLQKLTDALDESLADIGKIITDFIFGKATENLSDYEAIGKVIGDSISDGVKKSSLSNSIKDFFTSENFNRSIRGVRPEFYIFDYFLGSEKKASGGFVSGPGTSTSDSIPALLSNGEFVVNAKSTSRYRSVLEAMNRNRFSAGGFVGSASGLTPEQTVQLETYKRLLDKLNNELATIEASGGAGARKEIEGQMDVISRNIASLLTKGEANSDKENSFNLSKINSVAGEAAEKKISEAEQEASSFAKSLSEAFLKTFIDAFENYQLDRDAVLFARRIQEGINSNLSGAIISTVSESFFSGPLDKARKAAEKYSLTIQSLGSDSKESEAAMQAMIDEFFNLQSSVDELTPKLLELANRFVLIVPDDRFRKSGETAAKAIQTSFQTAFKDLISSGKVKDFFYVLADTFTNQILETFTESLTESLFNKDGPLGKLINKGLEDLFAGVAELGSNLVSKLAESLPAAFGVASKGASGVGGNSLSGLASLVSFLPRILGFDTGGVVPGRLGDPKLVLAHAGETILPTHRSDFETGSVHQTFNISITGDVSRQTRKEILSMLPEIASGVNSVNKERGFR
jgi:hypothetical protein